MDSAPQDTQNNAPHNMQSNAPHNMQTNVPHNMKNNTQNTMHDMGEPLDNTVSVLSRTLAQANCYLLHEMRRVGLENLSPSHGDILNQLFSSESLSMSELAERINRDPSTVTVLVKRLVNEGYVVTEKSTCDRRTVMVSLTEQGKGLKQQFIDISERLHRIQMQNIDAADARTTRRVLEQMQENLRAALEDDKDA